MELIKRNTTNKPFMSLFDDFDNLFGAPLISRMPAPVWRKEMKTPLNVRKLDDKYLIEVGISGYGKDDISIELDDDSLVISGSFGGNNKEDGEYLVKEFWHSNFSRRVKLSKDIDVDSITAELNGGILTVSVPRVEHAESKPRQIPITTT